MNALLAVFLSVAFAGPPPLEQSIRILGWLEPYVERHDLGRLRNLRRAAEATARASASLGEGHQETFREYQRMLLHFRYSDRFFAQVATPASTQKIRALSRLVQRISEEKGMENPAYSRVMADTLREMRELMRSIQRAPIPDALALKLKELMPALGRALAVCEQGDRPRAFEAIRVFHGEMARAVPLLDALPPAGDAFALGMQLSGLLDFLAEFAQIDGALP